MKILTASQMQRIDRLTTERYGVPSFTLMENAGMSVFEFLRQRYQPIEKHSILIVCGRGNNGGDGFVTARYLRQAGLAPYVLLLAEPSRLQGDALHNYSRLLESGSIHAASSLEDWRQFAPQLPRFTLLLDALLGTGLSKPLDGMLLQVVRDLNLGFKGKPVVAVDLPSGLSADSSTLIGDVLRATASVTFTAPKVAHIFPPACEWVGEWQVNPIGTPSEALDCDPELNLNLITRTELAWLNQPRPIEAHKGIYGHLLLVAASNGKTGAASMAARAALLAGAGLVTIAAPRSAVTALAALGVEYMTEPLAETETGTLDHQAYSSGRLNTLLAGKTAVAIGPGLGLHPSTAALVRDFVASCPLPMVIDADALNCLAGHLESLSGTERLRILTPHPGEMSRLCELPTARVQAQRIEVSRNFAARHGVCLVLKGARTIVAEPGGTVFVNPTGNPGMATGGTGDCLTGLLGGLLAQAPGRPPAELAAAAVYVHGLAGDLAAQKKGQRSMLAGDLLEAISSAFLALASAS